ncbi:hypothetical protein Bp8pS_300 [Bacillus phage vB_BpuM-BpSp]|nr:hypothetical protein Bp8pS_300 [Bacillus phage vB_BpuM-BpSp]
MILKDFDIDQKLRKMGNLASRTNLDSRDIFWEDFKEVEFYMKGIEREIELLKYKIIESNRRIFSFITEKYGKGKNFVTVNENFITIDVSLDFDSISMKDFPNEFLIINLSINLKEKIIGIDVKSIVTIERSLKESAYHIKSILKSKKSLVMFPFLKKNRKEIKELEKRLNDINLMLDGKLKFNVLEKIDYLIENYAEPIKNELSGLTNKKFTIQTFVR